MEDNKIKQNFYNTVAKNWKKLGEVYGNVSGQSMFVCFICLKNATNVDNIYNTSDASAFCWHIKQQHNTNLPADDDKEVVEKTLPKLLPENAEPTDLKSLINEEEHPTKLLESFHQSLVQNLTDNTTKEVHHIATTPHQTNIENDRILNSDYDYVNQSYTISDDENESVENLNTKCNRAGYPKHNDKVEISDDDSDIIETSTDLNSLANVLDTMNRTNLMTCSQPHTISENSLESHSNFYPVYPIPCIPTTDELHNKYIKENQIISTGISFISNESNYVPYKRKAYSTYKYRPFKCKFCNIRTANEKTMQIHEKRYHTSESDFETIHCEICKKRIYIPNLSQHMLVHSKAAFKCYCCGQYYKYKQSLKLHIQRMHSF